MRFDASGWNCKVAKVLPKHKGRVELIKIDDPAADFEPISADRR